MTPPRIPLRNARLVVLMIAAVAVALMLVSGPGTRLGLWPWQTGIALLRYGTYAGLAAILGAAMLLLVLLVPRLRAHPGVPVVALILGVIAVAPPMMMLARASQVPRIHDISTDLADPPAFVALAAARKASPNGLEHGGAQVAEAQRQAYPEIRPLIVKAAPAEAMQRAIGVARGMGLELAAADAAAGRLEGTATSVFFGFEDDVVVRIRPEGAGSRVDVRSVSRVGLSDLGANARRIREFLARLA